jgi:hypothetical protein
MKNFAKVGIDYHCENKMDVAAACRRLRRRNAMDAFDCANLSSDEAATTARSTYSTATHNTKSVTITYSTATHNAKPVTITFSLTLPDNFSTEANFTDTVSDAPAIALTN